MAKDTESNIEPSEKNKEEKVDQKKTDESKESEKNLSQSEEEKEKSEDVKPEKKEAKADKEQTPSESKDKSTKQKKEQKKKEKTDKKTKSEDEDFKYIVRIANTDIDGNKKVVHGLTMIKGIGFHMGSLIADYTGVDIDKKMGNLSDQSVKKIIDALNNLDNIAPSWMVNHRKDMETGEDIHLIGSDIDMRFRDEVNIMKKIRSYRGIRHERGLRVRGQRTRGNNRSGLTLGVSRKRIQEKK